MKYEGSKYLGAQNFLLQCEANEMFQYGLIGTEVFFSLCQQLYTIASIAIQKILRSAEVFAFLKSGNTDTVYSPSSLSSQGNDHLHCSFTTFGGDETACKIS